MKLFKHPLVSEEQDEGVEETQAGRPSPCDCEQSCFSLCHAVAAEAVQKPITSRHSENSLPQSGSGLISQFHRGVPFDGEQSWGCLHPMKTGGWCLVKYFCIFRVRETDATASSSRAVGPNHSSRCPRLGRSPELALCRVPVRLAGGPGL